MARPVVVLPAARLAHQAQRLAPGDGEGDVVHGADPAGLAPEHAAAGSGTRPAGRSPPGAGEPCVVGPGRWLRGQRCGIGRVVAVRRHQVGVRRHLGHADASRRSRCDLHGVPAGDATRIAGRGRWAGRRWRTDRCARPQRGRNGQPDEVGGEVRAAIPRWASGPPGGAGPGAAASAAARRCRGGAANAAGPGSGRSPRSAPRTSPPAGRRCPATTPRSWVMISTAMPCSRAQPSQQVQDLRLDGHVEGGRGLVRDEQHRLAGEGHGDHRALAHAAAELVRVVPQTRRGIRGCPPSVSSAAARRRRPPCPCPGGRSDSAIWSPTVSTGLRHDERVLEDEADAAAPDVLQLRLGMASRSVPSNVAVPDMMRAACSGSSRSSDSADTLLPGARLAHEAQRLARARARRTGPAPHGPSGRPRTPRAGRRPTAAASGTPHPRPRIDRVPQAVTDEVDGQHDERDGHGRRHPDPRQVLEHVRVRGERRPCCPRTARAASRPGPGS